MGVAGNAGVVGVKGVTGVGGMLESLRLSWPGSEVLLGSAFTELSLLLDFCNRIIIRVGFLVENCPGHLLFMGNLKLEHHILQTRMNPQSWTLK